MIYLNKKSIITICLLSIVIIAAGIAYFAVRNGGTGDGSGIPDPSIVDSLLNEQAEKVRQEAIDYVKMRELETSREFDKCKSKTTGSGIDDCFVSGSVLSGDESWCDKVGDEAKRRSCHGRFDFNRVVSENKDPQACLALMDQFIDSCLNSFFHNFDDLSDCDKFQGDDKVRCADIVKNSMAFESGDTGSCSSISDKSLRDECSQIASSKPEDSDGDGVVDNTERSYGTDPFERDTDGDGLSDFDELEKYLTDPKNADTDGDGYKDGVEIKNGQDPKVKK